jgi:uncharacterized protein
MIIDAHVHLGSCRVFDLDVTETAVLDSIDRHGIDVAVVQPFPGAPEPEAVHDRIAALAAKHPGRIYGLASLNPHRDADAYYQEIERCVRDLGFRAVKLHTLGHAVHPLHRSGRLVFETASALGIPVMVHTGMGMPFALPSLVLPIARQYPDTPVILAHAGHGFYTQEAMVAATLADNIYLETSWIAAVQVARLVRELGPERVMFGTDVLLNTASELAKYRSLELPAGQQDRLLSGTAAQVFRIPAAPSAERQ